MSPRRALLELFARMLPAPLVPSDLSAAGEAARVRDEQDARENPLWSPDTELRRAETALREAQQRLEAVDTPLRRLAAQVRVRERLLEREQQSPRATDDD